MLGFYYKIDSGSVLVNYNWLRSAPFFVRAFSFVFPTERESNLGFYRTRPVGLGLGLGGRSRSLYIASGIGPLFLSERFLSLTVRAQRSAGRRRPAPSLRPGSLRSCPAGSLIHVHVHVPRTGSLRPGSLGVRPVHLPAYACREQSSAPSSLVNFPSAQFTRLGRFTHRP